MERITSRTNPLCVRIRKLAASAPYRREEGRFLCDGHKLLTEALTWRPELLETVVISGQPELPALPSGVRIVEVPPDVMETLSPARTPQGVLAVCRIPARALPETLPGRHYVVLDGVQDPGNVGTILRTADALDADGLFLVNGCADLYAPKTVRAGMGAVFRRPVWMAEAETLRSLLTESKILLYGAALRSDTADVREVDYTRAAVALGSEGRGLSAQMLSLCDRTIRIPMNPHCESLNVAAAAAVLLWEMNR